MSLGGLHWDREARWALNFMAVCDLLLQSQRGDRREQQGWSDYDVRSYAQWLAILGILKQLRIDPRRRRRRRRRSGVGHVG